MIAIKVLSVLCILSVVNGYESEVTKFLKYFGVIPDVISVGPKDFLRVTYDNYINADKGVELTPTQVKNQPKVEWRAERYAYYTLIMTDPDAPSRPNPTMREWQHWLVCNIPGRDLSKGEVFSEYIGSAPPNGTGLHRYVFLLFKQPSKMTFNEPRLTNTSGEKRAKFSTQKFAEKYNLGNPVASNLFQAQWDNYVPMLEAQLGL